MLKYTCITRQIKWHWINTHRSIKIPYTIKLSSVSLCLWKKKLPSKPISWGWRRKIIYKYTCTKSWLHNIFVVIVISSKYCYWLYHDKGWIYSKNGWFNRNSILIHPVITAKKEWKSIIVLFNKIPIKITCHKTFVSK